MQPIVHPLSALFKQLGLPGDPESIERFIATHAPLPGDVRLSEAPFWTPSQAKFLREELQEDADWAEVVDQLNLMLREED